MSPSSYENVSDEALRNYLETFLEELEDTASKYLEPDLRQKMLHLSLLPAKIIGYVSTQFGVGFEYKNATKTSIEIIRGSGRVEDLLFHVPRRLRAIGPIIAIGGTDCGVFGATLSGGFPIRLTERSANVSIGDVRFELGSYHKDVIYAEIYGDRSARAWDEVTAIRRAKDLVLLAQVETGLAKKRGVTLDGWIDEFKQNTVLLLGAYEGSGMKRLQAIAECLRSDGYEPILVQDIPDHPHHDLVQKVVAVGAVSRFIVIDDTTPSGHIAELEKCKQNDWITILLHEGGNRSTFMTASAELSSTLIKDFDYDELEPEQTISNATAWAEEILSQRESQLSKTYPWRPST